MKINLSPCRMDETLSVIVSGDVLVVNGEVLDFSPLPEGAILPSEATGTKWLLGNITRKNGVIELTVIMPHGINASEAVRFPTPLNVTVNGQVELPT